MKKRMEEIEVEINEKGNTIEIKQDWHTGEEPQTVFFSVGQVDTLINWLQEAKLILGKKIKELP